MRLERRGWLAAVFVLGIALSLCCTDTTSAAAPESTSPNILLIVADDMGYSDLGCYGGDVETPNLDRLAKGGLRFTQFYNTARCWPTRAAILTGYYAQQVRRDAIPGIGGGAQGERPGWARLLPEMLKARGYRSYLSGKWHVDGSPLAGGFDHSYVLEDHNRNFNPQLHLEDDRKLPAVEPDSGFYTTTAIADHAIKCLKEHAAEHAGQPFFEFLTFTCPHFPLQAPAEDVAKYRDRYREGWDVMRSWRHERMRQMGLVNCELSPRTPQVPAWDTLSADEQRMWQGRMAVHAAMVDRMDREIGRVLDLLKANGTLDDTVVMFLSDNGASAERVLRGDGNDESAPLGSAKTFVCLEPGFANLANTPFRKSKIFVHEGGISTPLIVHWPAGLGQVGGQLRKAQGHVIDLVPTLLELTGASKSSQWEGKPIPPAPGKSLVKALAADVPIERDELWWFHSGHRALRVGDWKLVSSGPNGPWELYDLATDRGESHDLAEAQSQRASEMAKRWEQRLAEFRVLAAPEKGN